jgi:hypothetical protein
MESELQQRIEEDAEIMRLQREEEERERQQRVHRIVTPGVRDRAATPRSTPRRIGL